MTGISRWQADAGFPAGFADLDGIVDHVAGDDGVALGRRDADAAMARGMAGGRLQKDMVAHLMAAVHKVGQARLGDGQHAVQQGGLLLLPRQRGVMLELGALEEVAGVGEGGTSSPS